MEDESLVPTAGPACVRLVAGGRDGNGRKKKNRQSASRFHRSWRNWRRYMLPPRRRRTRSAIYIDDDDGTFVPCVGSDEALGHLAGVSGRAVLAIVQDRNAANLCVALPLSVGCIISQLSDEFYRIVESESSWAMTDAALTAVRRLLKALPEDGQHLMDEVGRYTVTSKLAALYSGLEICRDGSHMTALLNVDNRGVLGWKVQAQSDGVATFAIHDSICHIFETTSWDVADTKMRVPLLKIQLGINLVALRAAMASPHGKEDAEAIDALLRASSTGPEIREWSECMWNAPDPLRLLGCLVARSGVKGISTLLKGDGGLTVIELRKHARDKISYERYGHACISRAPVGRNSADRGHSSICPSADANGHHQKAVLPPIDVPANDMQTILEHPRTLSRCMRRHLSPRGQRRARIRLSQLATSLGQSQFASDLWGIAALQRSYEGEGDPTSHMYISSISNVVQAYHSAEEASLDVSEALGGALLELSRIGLTWTDGDAYKRDADRLVSILLCVIPLLTSADDALELRSMCLRAKFSVAWCRQDDAETLICTISAAAARMIDPKGLNEDECLAFLLRFWDDLPQMFELPGKACPRGSECLECKAVMARLAVERCIVAQMMCIALPSPPPESYILPAFFQGALKGMTSGLLKDDYLAINSPALLELVRGLAKCCQSMPLDGSVLSLLTKSEISSLLVFCIDQCLCKHLEEIVSGMNWVSRCLSYWALSCIETALACCKVCGENHAYATQKFLQSIAPLFGHRGEVYGQILQGLLRLDSPKGSSTLLRQLLHMGEQYFTIWTDSKQNWRDFAAAELAIGALYEAFLRLYLGRKQYGGRMDRCQQVLLAISSLAQCCQARNYKYESHGPAVWQKFRELRMVHFISEELSTEMHMKDPPRKLGASRRPLSLDLSSVTTDEGRRPTVDGDILISGERTLDLVGPLNGTELERSWREGDKVDGLFELRNGSKRWFPGIIQSVNDDGTLHIVYDDGDEEQRKKPDNVRRPRNRCPKSRRDSHEASDGLVTNSEGPSGRKQSARYSTCSTDSLLSARSPFQQSPGDAWSSLRRNSSTLSPSRLQRMGVSMVESEGSDDVENDIESESDESACDDGDECFVIPTTIDPGASTSRILSLKKDSSIPSMNLNSPHFRSGATHFSSTNSLSAAGFSWDPRESQDFLINDDTDMDEGASSPPHEHDNGLPTSRSWRPSGGTRSLYERQRGRIALYAHTNAHEAAVLLLFSVLAGKSFDKLSEFGLVLFTVQAHLAEKENATVIRGLVGRLSTLSEQTSSLVKISCADASTFDWASYTKGERMAAGRFGEIVAVSHADHGQALAAKVISRDLSPYEAGVGLKVFSEVHALQTLTHVPGVCRLLDFGVDSNQYFIIMERCKMSLADWRLARPVQPSASDCMLYLKLFDKILQAVKGISDAGVIHFDLKCDNILVRRNGASSDNPEICICDFGEALIATMGSHSGTDECSDQPYCLVRRARGTECIQSPELLGLASQSSADAMHGGLGHMPRRRNTDHHCLGGSGGMGVEVTGATDIWSLGCLLYELLTGEMLFESWDWAAFFVTLTAPQVGGHPSTLLTKDSLQKLSHLPLIRNQLYSYISILLQRDARRRPGASDALILLHKVQETIEFCIEGGGELPE